MSFTNTLIKKRNQSLGFGYIRRLKRIKHFPFIPTQIIQIIILFYGSGNFKIYCSRSKNKKDNPFYDICDTNKNLDGINDIANLTCLGINRHSYFVLTEHECYSCGTNEYGQLGSNTTNSNTDNFIKLTKFHPFNKLKNKPKLTSNGFNNVHTFLYTINNKLYGIGCNDKNQLGIYSNIKYLTPYAKLINFQFNDSLIDIQCGHKHTIFLTKKGIVFSCGYNQHNQLGHNIKIIKYQK